MKHTTIITIFFTVTSPTVIYTLSLHDALPICDHRRQRLRDHGRSTASPIPAVLYHQRRARNRTGPMGQPWHHQDRKSTRLNSSHVSISYAVFCLNKKKRKIQQI